MHPSEMTPTTAADVSSYPYVQRGIESANVEERIYGPGRLRSHRSHAGAYGAPYPTAWVPPQPRKVRQSGFGQAPQAAAQQPTPSMPQQSQTQPPQWQLSFNQPQPQPQFSFNLPQQQPQPWYTVYPQQQQQQQQTFYPPPPQ